MSSTLKFVIPQKLDDLSHSQGENNYYVNDVLTASEITDKLNETQDLTNLISDPTIIDREFHTFYSVLKSFSDIDTHIIDTYWTILFKTTNRFTDQFRELFITDSQTLFEAKDEKLSYTNALKMLLYLDCVFIQMFEDANSSQSHRQNFEEKIGGHAKRKKTQNSTKDKGMSFVEYDKYKVRVLKNLLQIISSPLTRVIDSPTEARDVVGQVMRVCYKIIENSSINNLSKNNDLLDIVFALLGCGIEKYNQSLTFCLKFIQLLQHREQLAAMLADLVEFIVTRHNQKLLIGEILREIDRIDIKDLSRDSSCPRAISTFLISLSEKCPDAFIPSIDHMFGYLEQDSYIMRNASLSIMANLIIKVLYKDDADKQLRDDILDTLQAHICDITGYTRSKALSVWCNLCENQCIPLSYIAPVTGAAVSRLSDKSCFVRKSAVRFITSILSRNPFAKKLPLKVFVQRHGVEKAILEKLKEDEKNRLEQEEETLSQDSQTSITSETDPNNVHPNMKFKDLVCAIESVVVTQERKVSFLANAISFTLQIHKAIPLTSELLHSKNIGDVQEAIDFFVYSYEFGIDEALVGFKKMIRLMKTQEKSIRDTISMAYKRIFFESSSLEGKSNKDSIVVKNLINFVQEASIGEFVCFEILIGQFIQSGDLNKDMERELWATFTRAKSNSTLEDAIAAIQLIGMIALIKPDIINHNLHLCVKHGLTLEESNFDEPNTRLIRETCIAIRKSLPRKIEIKSRSLRLARDDEIFIQLEKNLLDSFGSVMSESWFSMCDEAVKIFFDMAENPEKISESIIGRMVDLLLKNSVQCTDSSRNETPDFVFQPSTLQGALGSSQTNLPPASFQETSTGATQATKTMELVNPTTLARFIHFLGDVALDLAVFLELNVLVELKIRNVPVNESKDNISAQNISAHDISISSRRRSRRYASNVDDQNLEEEIGLGGAEAEDAELEFIGRICDEEIVCGRNLLSKLSRVILEVSKDPLRYHQPELKQASSLALAKFMMVSAKFCHDHLRLLFTILERTTDSAIKINLLIAISDLCVRFPNQLDGWTGKIFDCLQSEDVQVRRAALKILSRLILCDILKAKDQISTIANLIVDEDEQISSFSRHFFLELSKKLNAIYNVLPDIISRLSDNKTGISEESFHIVMKFMFDLIDRSQHIDRLVDKLCGRFMDTDNERSWADLAYCLSLLKYSDKSMAKLFDKFDCYKDKLCIDAVGQSISSAVASYKKTPNLKSEMKQMLEEFEARIAKCIGEREEGEDHHETEGVENNGLGQDDETEVEDAADTTADTEIADD